MRCSSCGTQLPEEAAFCPTCGAFTPYRASEPGASPYDLTVASASSGASQPKPATDYSSPPYGAPPQNPYEPLNPYEAPLRPPPPPPPQRHVKLGLLIGGVVLVLIVASASVFALFTQLAKNTRPGETTPSRMLCTGER